MAALAEQNINNYVDKMKYFQETLLNFIYTKSDAESHYQNIISFFENQQIRENRNELHAVLHLLLKISNDHQRNRDYFEKVGKILTHFKEDIQTFYSNYEIFQLFKSNKRLLLFLFKAKFIVPDRSIASFITCPKYKEAHYPHFFLPELGSFYDDHIVGILNEEAKTLSEGELTPEAFDRKRDVGENDHVLSEIIRTDSIDQFTSHMEKTNQSLSSNIESSLFETNSFLINKTPTLIEYSAFFGSMKIFKYLVENDVVMTPSLWLFAIHSNNIDLIQFLVEKKIKPEDESFKNVFVEAIKCHHNQIAKTIQNNHVEKKLDVLSAVSSQAIKYYNFAFFQTQFKFNEIKAFCDFCRYNYFYIVKQFLTVENLPINSQTISLKQFFNTISIVGFLNDVSIQFLDDNIFNSKSGL